MLTYITITDFLTFVLIDSVHHFRWHCKNETQQHWSWNRDWLNLVSVWARWWLKWSDMKIAPPRWGLLHPGSPAAEEGAAPKLGAVDLDRFLKSSFWAMAAASGCKLKLSVPSLPVSSRPVVGRINKTIRLTCKMWLTVPCCWLKMQSTQ